MAPGAASALAEWIVEREPGMDLSDVDVARFHPFQINRRYLAGRTAESLSTIYHMRWPNWQHEFSRPIRKIRFMTGLLRKVLNSVKPWAGNGPCGMGQRKGSPKLGIPMADLDGTNSRQRNAARFERTSQSLTRVLSVNIYCKVGTLVRRFRLFARTMSMCRWEHLSTRTCSMRAAE